MAASQQAKRVPFESLSDSDLQLDAIYTGGTSGTVRDDPLAKLLPCGNQGGFRYKSSASGGPLFVVLYTDLGDPDWPDLIDPELGRFVYYGDNKRPGHELHDTHRGGNRILRDAFTAVHDQPARRGDVPPFFVFTKGGVGRDVAFRGLALPGAPGITSNDDLVAVWRSRTGQRFQNYRAIFTLLDTGTVITRAWLKDVVAGTTDTANAPPAWLVWRKNGIYQPLAAPRIHSFRTPQQQQPETAADAAIIEAIRRHFHDRPTAFEPCAAAIWQMYAPDTEHTVTRGSRDGGRDATGHYRLGPVSDPIRLDFALEAKCFAPTNSCGVRELSRLISRLRHRQFGVLVTTSFLAAQAYEELRADGHPVVVIAARDIVEALKKHDLATPAATKAWLEAEFPAS